jgi:hypothetical protein
MPQIKVKLRVRPPPPAEYAYLEQVGPNDWAVAETGETLTAQDAIERFQCLTQADADLLANDAYAALEAEKAPKTVAQEPSGEGA